MTIVFPCQRCGHPNEVEGEWAGRRSSCERCGEEVTVPAPRLAGRATVASGVSAGASRIDPLVIPLDEDDLPAGPAKVREEAEPEKPKVRRRIRQPKKAKRRRRESGDMMSSLVLWGMVGVAFIALGAWILTFFQDSPLKRFTSASGRFSVLYPGEPTDQTQPMSGVNGKLNLRCYSLPVRGGEYITFFADLPDALPSSFLAIDLIAHGMVEAARGRVSRQKLVKLDGHIGKEYTFSMPANADHPDGMGRVRLFMVQHRVYGIGVLGSEARHLNKNTLKFFESFTLQKTPAPAPVAMAPGSDAVADGSAESAAEVERLAEKARDAVETDRPAVGAARYEEAARLDPVTSAWYWKEAGLAWLQAGETARGLAAAREADAAEPEARNTFLVYFWHRGLGEIYLKAGEAAPAISHFEIAIEKTTSQEYKKACQKDLEAARALLPAKSDAEPKPE